MTLPAGTGSMDTDSFCISAREMSPMSSMKEARCRAALTIMDAHSRCSAVRSPRQSSSPKPRTVLIGVRSSWLTLDTYSVLASCAACHALWACSSSPRWPVTSSSTWMM